MRGTLARRRAPRATAPTRPVPAPRTAPCGRRSASRSACRCSVRSSCSGVPPADGNPPDVELVDRLDRVRVVDPLAVRRPDRKVVVIALIARPESAGRCRRSGPRRTSDRPASKVKYTSRVPSGDQATLTALSVRKARAAAAGERQEAAARLPAVDPDFGPVGRKSDASIRPGDRADPRHPASGRRNAPVPTCFSHRWNGPSRSAMKATNLRPARSPRPARCLRNW